MGIVEIADFLTVKDVRFETQVLPLVAVVVILPQMRADQMINIAGLVGFLTVKNVQSGMQVLLPAAVAAIGQPFELNVYF